MTSDRQTDEARDSYTERERQTGQDKTDMRRETERLNFESLNLKGLKSVVKFGM